MMTRRKVVEVTKYQGSKPLRMGMGNSKVGNPGRVESGVVVESSQGISVSS